VELEGSRLKNLDLGQVISILANVGVIAGILFLAIELRQNNEHLAAQSSFAQFSLERERRTRLMENPDGFTELVVKARSEAPLTDVERVRINAMSNDYLDSWRWQFREFQAGRLPSEFLDLDLWRAIFARDYRLRDQFERDRAELGQDFVRFMEENVVNGHNEASLPSANGR